MSALSLLAGFLNSSCYSINLSSPIEEYRRFVSGWYPFPVHTVPVEEDFVVCSITAFLLSSDMFFYNFVDLDKRAALSESRLAFSSKRWNFSRLFASTEKIRSNFPNVHLSLQFEKQKLYSFVDWSFQFCQLFCFRISYDFYQAFVVLKLFCRILVELTML